MWTPNTEQIVTAAQKVAEAEAFQRLVDFPNLEPDQFWFAVRLSGHEQKLIEWIESLKDGSDPLLWAAASSKLEHAKFFERDHPFVEAAREAIGMTTQELDILWSYAQQ